MKKVILYLLFSFLMMQTLSAQITYTVEKHDVQCNNSELGKVKIEVTSSGSYTFLWNTGQTTNIVTDLSEGNYSILVTDTSLAVDVDTTVSISIKTNECSMAGAIVFTPNNDGFNDTWAISNYQYFPDSWVMIYNRLGQKVYDHKGLYEQWDGTDLLGIPVPASSYFYIIYEDKSDEKTIIKGSVSIVR